MKFYMLVLALDTTTRRGSAALTRDGVVIGTYVGDATITHGERLPGDLIRLLTAHGLRLSEVDLFAVAAGPGSFTGLRIGIATQQGLALANNKPLVGISALDAVNHATRVGAVPALLSADAVVGVWMDAHRGQVFSALYQVDRAIEGPTVEKPADVLARWAWPGPDVFTGDGALGYSPLIQQAFPDAHIVLDLPLLAPSIGWLAEEHLRRHGAEPPDRIRPIYVRRSDAELARDRVKS